MLRIETWVKVLAILMFACAVALPMRPLKRMTADRFDRIANALEAYALDNGGNYPPDSEIPAYRLPTMLTTPIAYLSGQEMIDPLSTAAIFPTAKFYYRNVKANFQQNPTLWQDRHQIAGDWIVASVGYDRTISNATLAGQFLYYDPTNGTISGGDIIRTQRVPSEVGHPPVP